MMRISTGQWYRQSVNAMLDNQTALNHTQLQLATGERLLAPSDDPMAAARIMELDQRLAELDQYQRNADFAELRLRAEEEALGGATDLVQRVRELAVQGLNDSLNADDRKAIAMEVRQHLDGLVQLANDRDANGDYLFGGYRTATAPIRKEGEAYLYAGDQGSRQVQIGGSRQVRVNDTADAIFMGLDDGSGGTTDLFSLVEGLAQQLESNAPAGEILDGLDQALTRLGDTRASIGGRLNAIDNQREVNDSLKLILQENRSTLADLDYAEAVSRFEQQSLVLQASQQTFMKIEGLSLFNYL